MKSTPEARVKLRAEFDGPFCPGCGGELPIHKVIMRADGMQGHVATRCSWGDTVALLEDLEEVIALTRPLVRDALYSLHGGWGCVFCNYADHDDDGTERHEDECPLYDVPEEAFEAIFGKVKLP